MDSEYRSSWLRQFSLLCRRSFAQTFRNSGAVKIKITINLFLALLLGAIYSKPSDGQKAINDRLGILFFVAANSAFSELGIVLNTFPREKAIITRERASKAYRLSAYDIHPCPLSYSLGHVIIQLTENELV